MLPQNQQLVLKRMNQTVPEDDPSNLSTLSRFVDYTAIVANHHDAGKSTLASLIPCLLLVFFCSCLSVSTPHFL